MARIVVKVFSSTSNEVCNVQVPLIRDLEGKFEGKVEFEYLNAEENQGQVSNYRIKEYPTIIIECDGKEKERFVGLTQQLFLERALEKLMRGSR